MQKVSYRMKRQLLAVMILTAGTVAIILLSFVFPREDAAENNMSPHALDLPDPEAIDALPADGGDEFNRLIHEESPYLLQHAANPVDWYPWGPEALAAAAAQDKPIFLSVGYSACHWCHVMETESFSRQDVADIINAHFIPIKVDREERPDVDQVYMLATQLMTGRGGWPNSLWLTPDGKPWFAGTYWPREDSAGRAGFKTILTTLGEAWRTKRDEVNAQADHLANVMQQYAAGRPGPTAGGLSWKLLTDATDGLYKSFDKANGGFGDAPKFPPHSTLRLLAAQYVRTRDAKLLEMLTGTLDAMAAGGMHDQLGGGFHRYSTDERWLLPHFEKMLYDNAQLARAYVEVYLITGNESYRQTAVDTLDWVLREMPDDAGGFHSAIDADSQGEEGKFYVWTYREIIDALGDADGKEFCRAYGVEKGGNFRDEATGTKPGTNVLHLPKPLDGDDKQRGRLAEMRTKLLAVRAKRIWPHIDDKVLTGWNALMIGSFAYAGKHLDEPRYVQAAQKAADFLLAKMRPNGRLLRTYRRGEAKLDAYLDDYAFFAEALIELHIASGDKRWLSEAAATADAMTVHFRDAKGGGFYFTSDDADELITRMKDPTDRAIPAGNAAAAAALIRLAELTGDEKYLTEAKSVLDAFEGYMQRMPSATSSMLLAAGEYLTATIPTAAPTAP